MPSVFFVQSPPSTTSSQTKVLSTARAREASSGAQLVAQFIVAAARLLMEVQRGKYFDFAAFLAIQRCGQVCIKKALARIGAPWRAAFSICTHPENLAQLRVPTAQQVTWRSER